MKHKRNMNSQIPIAEEILFQKTEIHWLDCENSSVENLIIGSWVNWLSKKLTLSNWYKIIVHFDDATYETQMQEKFTLQEIWDERLPELFFVTKPQFSKGYMSTSSKKAFIAWNGFWILKSAISWFATHMNETDEGPFSIHGSGFSQDEVWWIVMVGWHGAWKTTSLINLVSILEWPKTITSDDWLLWSKSWNWNLIIDSTDQTISLSHKTLSENPSLHLSNEERELLMKRKKSFQPQEIFGKDTISWPVKVDNVVLLIQWTWKRVQKLHDLSGIPEFIVASTYHYPYTNKFLIWRHLNFWRGQLRDTNVWCFDRSHNNWNDTRSSYVDLVNNIIRCKK